LISNIRRVLNIVVFLSGDSLASEFYVQTFRNTLSHPKGGVHTTYKDGTECSETSAHKIQAPRNQPKEKTQQFIEQLSDCQPLKKNAAAAVPCRQPSIPPVGLC